MPQNKGLPGYLADLDHKQRTVNLSVGVNAGQPIYASAGGYTATPSLTAIFAGIAQHTDGADKKGGFDYPPGTPVPVVYRGSVWAKSNIGNLEGVVPAKFDDNGIATLDGKYEVPNAFVVETGAVSGIEGVSEVAKINLEGIASLYTAPISYAGA